jgi:hypothetical protein
MADTKISGMPAASALTGAELLAGVQSAANVKITVDQLKDFTDGGIMGTPMGYQQITSLAAATGLTVPGGAVRAVVVVESHAVRWRDDGVNPTSSLGMLLGIGEELNYAAVDLSAIKFIEQTASAVLNISYYG